MKNSFKFTIGLLAVILTMQIAPISSYASDEIKYTPSDYELAVNEEHRQELRDIWDDYTIDSMYCSSEKLVTASIGMGGDILIALDSITDHVGLVIDNYTVIEAHPENDNGGVDYRDNDWPSRYSEIKGLRVSNTTVANRVGAISYAKAQYGKPYSLATTHWTEDKWYCSKLVWRAWYEQGFDIEGKEGEGRGTHVTPGDILDSPLTYVFYE